METGVVKMFNGDRGYGFIKPDDGGPDVFLYASALEQAGIGNLADRLTAIFRLSDGSARRQNQRAEREAALMAKRVSD